VGALEVARRAAQRYCDSADAWVLLGEAYLAAFRQQDALVAFEQALSLEERPDAAMAAGDLYARRGDFVNAGARYARAYAAGAGPDALRANARALKATGDYRAAEEAIRLWRQVTGKEWVEEE
jgi:Flp pilus assembly protein TadD